MAMNYDQLPTVRIDLADADEYGLKSQTVRIDNGHFSDGMPYYIKAEIRVYCDEQKFTFSSFGACLDNSFGYYDMEEMMTFANAPIIKPDSDVLICVVNSETREVYKPCILHTSAKVAKHCSTPLTFTDTNNWAFPYMANVPNKDLREKYAERFKARTEREENELNEMLKRTKTN